MKKKNKFTIFWFVIVIFTYNSTLAVLATSARETIAQKSNLADAVITLKDLPPGFIEIFPPELATLKRKALQEKLSIENFFVFQNNEETQFQLLIGCTMLPLDSLVQDVLRMRVQDLMHLIAKPLSAIEQDRGIKVSSRETQELTQLDNIGDLATGLTKVLLLSGIPVRMDLVTFRRGKVLAFTIAIYAEGSVPAVAIADIARQLDNRILNSTR